MPTEKRKTRFSGESNYSKKQKASEVVAKFPKALQRIYRSVESKELVTYVSPFSLDSAAPTFIAALSANIGQGSDTTQRIGRKTTHKYVEVTMLMAQNGTSAIGDAGYWLVVLDCQPDGALAAFTDVVDTTTVTNQGLAFKNTLLYQERFQILAREEYCIGAAVGGSLPYYKKRYIDLTRLPGMDATVNWNSTAAGIGSVSHGAILILIATAGQNGAGVPTTVSYGAKYRFTDV